MTREELQRRLPPGFTVMTDRTYEYVSGYGHEIPCTEAVRSATLDRVQRTVEHWCRIGSALAGAADLKSAVRDCENGHESIGSDTIDRLRRVAKLVADQETWGTSDPKDVAHFEACR